jgi:hypothetical protein
MKKIIISALLAGSTALAASSALALDPCKYSAGLGLGWSIQDKATYNIKSDDNAAVTFTSNKYGFQKGFPNIDLKLGYNVNSYLQIGVNALYTNKIENDAMTFVTAKLFKTQESFINVAARAHFYSPETSNGTSMFMGPNVGWQNTKMKVALAEGQGSFDDYKDSKRKNEEFHLK